MKCSYNSKAVKARKQYQKEQKQYQKGIDTATDGMIIMLLYVLADKHNFNDMQLAQVLHDVTYVADSVHKNYISLDDLKDTLKKEHGITFSV